MPKAYVIVTEAINDPSGMDAYMRAVRPTIVQSGASVLAATQPQVVEGQWHGNRTVILEFASAEAARAWYESDAYEKVKPLRLAAAECNAVIVPGFDMPSGG
ncbi:DUF1330 domain-containing protein [Streptomyces sp. CA-249302]|uniref:DUF1330 domain-containing protein n=1 Tax=Streptomyces sp. CA-249302 TaxID=3240058 RepID=UPI003D8D34EF